MSDDRFGGPLVGRERLATGQNGSFSTRYELQGRKRKEAPRTLPPCCSHLNDFELTFQLTTPAPCSGKGRMSLLWPSLLSLAVWEVTP